MEGEKEKKKKEQDPNLDPDPDPQLNEDKEELSNQGSPKREPHVEDGSSDSEDGSDSDDDNMEVLMEMQRKIQEMQKKMAQKKKKKSKKKAEQQRKKKEVSSQQNKEGDAKEGQGTINTLEPQKTDMHETILQEGQDILVGTTQDKTEKLAKKTAAAAAPVPDENQDKSEEVVIMETDSHERNLQEVQGSIVGATQDMPKELAKKAEAIPDEKQEDKFEKDEMVPETGSPTSQAPGMQQKESNPQIDSKKHPEKEILQEMRDEQQKRKKKFPSQQSKEIDPRKGQRTTDGLEIQEETNHERNLQEGQDSLVGTSQDMPEELTKKTAAVPDEKQEAKSEEPETASPTFQASGMQQEENNPQFDLKKHLKKEILQEMTDEQQKGNKKIPSQQSKEIDPRTGQRTTDDLELTEEANHKRNLQETTQDMSEELAKRTAAVPNEKQEAKSEEPETASPTPQASGMQQEESNPQFDSRKHPEKEKLQEMTDEKVHERETRGANKNTEFVSSGTNDQNKRPQGKANPELTQEKNPSPLEVCMYEKVATVTVSIEETLEVCGKEKRQGETIWGRNVSPTEHITADNWSPHLDIPGDKPDDVNPNLNPMQQQDTMEIDGEDHKGGHTSSEEGTSAKAMHDSTMKSASSLSTATGEKYPQDESFDVQNNGGQPNISWAQKALGSRAQNRITGPQIDDKCYDAAQNYNSPISRQEVREYDMGKDPRKHKQPNTLAGKDQSSKVHPGEEECHEIYYDVTDKVPHSRNGAHTQGTNRARKEKQVQHEHHNSACLLYTSPSPRDRQKSRMPSSA